MVPVFANHEEDAEIVAHYFAVVPWYVYFSDELPTGTAPIHTVIESSCGHIFTFEISGRKATLLSSNEDVHDRNYDGVIMKGEFGTFAHDTCLYTMTVYPTYEYHVQYVSNNPAVYMVVVLSIFVMTTLAFVAFDCLVVRRQKALIITARKQNALVSSLFPVSTALLANTVCEPIHGSFLWLTPFVCLLCCSEIYPKEVDGRYGR